LKKTVLSGTEKGNDVKVDLAWDVPSSSIATFSVHRAGPNFKPEDPLPPAVLTEEGSLTKLDGMRSIAKTDKNSNDPASMQNPAIPRLTEASLFNYIVVAHDPATGLSSKSGVRSTALAMVTSALGVDDLHLPVSEIHFVDLDNTPKFTSPMTPKFTSMAAGSGQRSVFLKWQMPWSWNVTSKTFYSGGYVVFRSESPDKDFIQVSKLLPKEDPQFNDTSLQPNTTYYYQVLALTPEGEIGWATPVKSVSTTETLAEQLIKACATAKAQLPKFLKFPNTSLELPLDISGCTADGKHAGSLTLPNGTKASFRGLEVEKHVFVDGVIKATVKGGMPEVQWHTAHEAITLKKLEGKAGGAFNAYIAIELKAHPLRIKGMTEISSKKDLQLTNVTTEFTGPRTNVKLSIQANPSDAPKAPVAFDAPATNDGYLGDPLKVDPTSSKVVLTEAGLSANFVRSDETATMFLPVFPTAMRKYTMTQTSDIRMIAFAQGIKVALKNSRIASGNIDKGELRMELALGCGGGAQNSFLQAKGSLSISPGTGALFGDVTVGRVVSLSNPGVFPTRELVWSAFTLKWQEAQKATLYIPGATTSTLVPTHMLAHMQQGTALPKQLTGVVGAKGAKGLDAGLNFAQGDLFMRLPGELKKLEPEFVSLYARPSGMGGLFRDQKGFPYSLYGFPTAFSRVGGVFFQNQLTKSEINANIKVPHPKDKSQKGAEFDVEGWGLNCGCLGNGPTKETLTPLPYWGVKLTPATLAFKAGNGGSCPASNDPDPRLVVTSLVEIESVSEKGKPVRRVEAGMSAKIGFRNNGHIPDPAEVYGKPETRLYVGLGTPANPSTDYAFTYFPTALTFSDPDKPICAQPWAMSGCTSTFEPEVFCSKDTSLKDTPVGKLPSFSYTCVNSADKNKAGRLDNNKAGVVGISGEIKFPWFGAVPTTALIVPAAGGLKKDYVFFDKPIPISREFTDGGGKKFEYEVSYLPPAAGHPPQFVGSKAATIAGMNADSTVVISARKGVQGPTAVVALDGATLPALAWSVGPKMKKWGSKDYAGDLEDAAGDVLELELPTLLDKAVTKSLDENRENLAKMLSGLGVYVAAPLKTYFLNYLTFATVEELYGYGVVSEEKDGDSLDGLGGKLTLSVKNVFDKGYVSFSGKKDGSFGISFSTGKNDKDDKEEEGKKAKFRVFGTTVASASFGLQVDTQAQSVNGSMNLEGLSLPPIPGDFVGPPDPNRLIVTELGGMLGIGTNPGMAYVGASVGLTVQGYSVSGRFLIGGNIPAPFALSSGILDPDAKALLDEALLSEGQITDATLTGVYTSAGIAMPMPVSPIACGPLPTALYKAVIGADGAFWILGSSGGYLNVGARLYGYAEAEAACILSASGGLGFAVNAGKEFLMRGRANIALAIYLFLGTWDLGASVAATFPAGGDVKVQDTSATSEWTWAWD
jgi:hypothetical protein